MDIGNCGIDASNPREWEPHLPPCNNPITGIAGCCARATTGHATALPSPAMNSRRRMSDLLRLDRQPIPVGAICLALTQSFFAAREAGFGPLPTSACTAACLHLAKADVACPIPSASAQGGPHVREADW